MSSTVLVVEDDRFLQEKLLQLLSAEGYAVEIADSGEDAAELMQRRAFDMVVLDLGLPGMDGITTCRRIRQSSKVPLLILTSRAEASARILGLESGADDYLTKPFDPMELVARIRAHLRRAQEYQPGPSADERPPFEIDCLKIDFDRREVSVSGRVVDLTSKEYEVLAYLAHNLDRAISREQLFDQVWGYDEEFGTNSLDVHIYRLRKKIEANAESPRLLHTIRGYGYRLGLAH